MKSIYRQRRAKFSCLFYYPDLRKKSNCYTLKKYERGTTANRPDVNTCRHEIESRRQRMKKSSDEMPIKRRAGMSNRQCKYHPYRRVFCKMLHISCCVSTTLLSLLVVSELVDIVDRPDHSNVWILK